MNRFRAGKRKRSPNRTNRGMSVVLSADFGGVGTQENITVLTGSAKTA
jgi:hypothetical protein